MTVFKRGKKKKLARRPLSFHNPFLNTGFQNPFQRIYTTNLPTGVASVEAAEKDRDLQRSMERLNAKIYDKKLQEKKFLYDAQKAVDSNSDVQKLVKKLVQKDMEGGIPDQIPEQYRKALREYISKNKDSRAASIANAWKKWYEIGKDESEADKKEPGVNKFLQEQNERQKLDRWNRNLEENLMPDSSISQKYISALHSFLDDLVSAFNKSKDTLFVQNVAYSLQDKFKTIKENARQLKPEWWKQLRVIDETPDATWDGIKLITYYECSMPWIKGGNIVETLKKHDMRFYPKALLTEVQPEIMQDNANALVGGLEKDTWFREDNYVENTRISILTGVLQLVYDFFIMPDVLITSSRRRSNLTNFLQRNNNIFANIETWGDKYGNVYIPRKDSEKGSGFMRRPIAPPPTAFPVTFKTQYLHNSVRPWVEKEGDYANPSEQVENQEKENTERQDMVKSHYKSVYGVDPSNDDLNSSMPALAQPMKTKYNDVIPPSRYRPPPGGRLIRWGLRKKPKNRHNWSLRTIY